MSLGATGTVFFHEDSFLSTPAAPLTTLSYVRTSAATRLSPRMSLTVVGHSGGHSFLSTSWGLCSTSPSAL